MCCKLASAARCIDWGSNSYQLVEDAVVQGHLSLAALEEVVVVVLEAVGVSLELVEAVGVNVLDTVRRSVSCPAHTSPRPKDRPVQFLSQTTLG
jgi:hypothetical protein